MTPDTLNTVTANIHRVRCSPGSADWSDFTVLMLQARKHPRPWRQKTAVLSLSLIRSLNPVLWGFCDCCGQNSCNHNHTAYHRNNYLSSANFYIFLNVRTMDSETLTQRTNTSTEQINNWMCQNFLNSKWIQRRFLDNKNIENSQTDALLYQYSPAEVLCIRRQQWATAPCWCCCSVQSMDGWSHPDQQGRSEKHTLVL